MTRNISEPNYYALLGVSTEATPEEIKHAYRTLALKNHPDKIDKDDTQLLQEATATFQAISNAYEILRDPTQRAQYDDRSRQSSESIPHMGATSNSFFNPNFTRQAAHSTASADHTTSDTPPRQPHRPETYAVKPIEPFLETVIDTDDISHLQSYLATQMHKDAKLLHTIFYYAGKKGKGEIFKHMIEQYHCDPELTVSGIPVKPTHYQFASGKMIKVVAINGHLALVRYLVEHHRVGIESWDYSDCWKGTILSCTARAGHADVVEYLLQHGARVDWRAPKNLLQQAILSDNPAIIRLLVESGAAVSQDALQTAFLVGNTDIINYLLSQKPGIQNHNFDQFTPPAVFILLSGRLDAIQSLETDYGFDLLAPFRSCSSTTLHLTLISAAAYSGSLAVLRYILDTKGLRTLLTHTDTAEKCLHYALMSAAGKKVLLIPDEIPHTISSDEQITIMRYLLEDLCMPISHTAIKTVLKQLLSNDIAIRAYLHSRIPTLPNEIKLLLQTVSRAGFDQLNIPELFRVAHYLQEEDPCSEYIDFSLNQLREQRHLSLEQLAELAQADEQFKIDALFYYAQRQFRDNLEPLQRLIALGASANAHNAWGKSVLNHAFQFSTYDLFNLDRNYTAIVKFLIEHGADVHERTQENESVFDALKDHPEFKAQYSRCSARRSTGRDHTLQAKQPDVSTAYKPLRQLSRYEYIPSTNWTLISATHRTCFLETIDASECIEILSMQLPEDIKGQLSSKALKTQLSALLEHPRNDLAICDINDTVGAGVFASADIPKDTVLCFYAGTLIRGKPTIRDDYALGYYGTDISITSQHHRGIASLFQHLPKPLRMPDFALCHTLLNMQAQPMSQHELKLSHDLYTVTFAEEYDATQLATANIRLEYVVFRGYPVVLLVTDQPISRGDQLGFDYGHAYWHSRQQVPELFDRTGAVIPANYYKRTFGQLNIDDFQYVGNLTSLIEKLELDAKEITLTNSAGIKKTVSAMKLTSALIQAHAITYEEAAALPTHADLAPSNTAPLFSVANLEQLRTAMLDFHAQLGGRVSTLR